MNRYHKKLLFGLAVGFLSIVIVAELSLLSNRTQSVTTASTIDSWGLGFGKEGTQPSGNVSQEALSEYNAYYIGETDAKVCYLTFDAGYENGCTEDILDVLKANDVKAAFFLVGSYIRKNPEIVKRMADEGHIVGNHTDTHPDMSKITDIASFKAELDAVEVAYFEATGKEMSYYYRPPQGKFSKTNLEQAKELGYKTIFWSLAYVDWYENDQPTADEAFSKLIPRLHNGCILLLHSTSHTNAQILDELIKRYKALGYEFKTLDDLG